MAKILAKKKKKTILTSVLIGSIVAGVVGLVIVFKISSSSKPNQSPKPNPPRPQIPPLPKENDNCPYTEKKFD